MINTIIIDDEKRSVETLSILLREHNSDIHILDVAHSVEEGLQVVRKHEGNIDIVFLDVQMPDGDGFSLLKELDKINFRIIFITAYDQYAIHAIKFSALDYLLKPVNNKDLAEALGKYASAAKGSNENIRQFKEKLVNNKPFERLAIPTLTDINFVELNQVVYLESDKNYTTIYFANAQKSISSKNIGYYEEILESHGFCRIHNSYIVNLSKVKRYIKGKHGLLELDNGSKIEVSPRRKDELFSRLGL